MALIETAFQDLSYGAKAMWRSRGASFIIISTLAFGIGACTLIFAIVDAE
jgi:uncharacterized membrane protein